MDDAIALLSDDAITPSIPALLPSIFGVEAKGEEV
ncbi:hypothetical protein Cri9333_0005 [Crinalium epipsammum PCC 9333]|uniref:Uncharacterized protein n=1 Tax=Crinalium epipsammum PCC 9333 TaxID=1173022 RepID=K9VU67_9CYAN|nr:hypothetical protein Cri9333_0005 [Crinalium epipsammum PCC 9333]